MQLILLYFLVITRMGINNGFLMPNTENPLLTSPKGGGIDGFLPKGRRIVTIYR